LIEKQMCGVGKKNKYNGYEVHGRLYARYHRLRLSDAGEFEKQKAGQ
jgi:hypothetical protein